MSEGKIFGYFEDANQVEPAFDPGLSAKCLVCGNQLSLPVVTVSLMLKEDERSYFYRIHKNCDDELNDDQRQSLDSIIIDAVAGAKNLN